MDNIFVKILRFIFFLPICFIVMAFINWGLGHLLLWFLGLSGFWFFLVIIFLGGIIWRTFKLISSILVMAATYISPIKWLSISTISILALLNGVYLCYTVWIIKNNYSAWDIFGSIIATVLIFELTYALIYGAICANSEYN